MLFDNKITMNIILNKIVGIFKPWFAVDTRSLGLFRIVFGFYVYLILLEDGSSLIFFILKHLSFNHL